MKIAAKIVRWMVVGSALFLLGCASPDRTAGPTQVVCPESVTTAAAVEAAHEVLADMHFAIEKLDVDQGVVRTRPLRAGQFFEFWRSDNVGAFDAAEANLQSIRRIVEVRVSREAAGDGLETGDANNPQPADSGLRMKCDVHVQRLALPANEIAGISQAYRIHTRSDRTVQALDVTPEQRAQMAWIDLGPDPDLAAEILRRIERRLEH